MPVVFHQAPFLPDYLLGELVRILRTPGWEWRRSEQQGHAGRGNVRQLLERSRAMDPAMRTLEMTVATYVYEALASEVEIPPSDALIPQVYPVQIVGDPDIPPFHLPNQDHHNGIAPLYTCLFYPIVDEVIGGALIGYERDAESDELVPEFRVVPSTNSLFVLPGTQVHSVELVSSGFRVTVVCNFYE